ncbi:DUF349 domain-containing protein [Flavicella sediminum]|uniref:DUF349 domain-containing protein n=1 Tax=Flavicella sediminum TaxID=2585141 RepID=UPI00112170E4|nr:DUF349 domain-containing protein [Flavicella sediminum]
MLDNSNENSQEPKEVTPIENTADSTSENKVENAAEVSEAIEKEATAKVVEAIEDKVAADSEDSEDKETVPEKDFQSMSLEELVAELGALLKDQKVQAIKSNVESLKKVFDAKFGVLLAEKKAAFLAEGGESIDFHYASPIKTSFNDLIAEYKNKRKKHYSDLDSRLKENLNKRIEVIDELKDLIEKADSTTMYKEFKTLQDRWKAIGPVPRTKYNNTWRNYHHHVERFYDLLHLNNDLRELDFKHNLEEKIKIVEKAEALTKLDDVGKAFKELQELHKLWKEDIGPVSREFREEVWQKFSAATKIIHDKRDAFYEGQKAKYDENIQLKLAVIQSLEAFDVSANKTHSDWQKSIKIFEAKREEFFKIGKVPRNKSQIIWDQLKAATKKFNHNKNVFYKELNKEQQTNLEKKLALVELAESLKDSEEYATATQEMKRIQAEWRKIGHVPRKFSDKIWKQFKDACNHYFDRIHKIQDTGSNEEIEALATKKEFLSQLNAVIGNENIKLEEVKAYIETWKNIGRVPRKEKGIDNEFNAVIEKLFKQLSIEGDELALLKYKLSIDALVAANNTRKLDSEVTFLRKKIDEVSKGIQQLDNNISFIANADETNPLVINVRNSIKEQSKELNLWKSKLTYIRSLAV